MRLFFFYLPKLLQNAGLRAYFALPEAAHRWLAGPPDVDKEAQLAPDLQGMLKALTAENVTSLTGNHNLTGARDLARDLAFAARPLSDIGGVVSAPIRLAVARGNKGVTTLNAVLYTPQNGFWPGAGPLILYLHGGGWVTGDLEMYDAPCKLISQRSGLQLLSLAYRLAPEHPFPAALEDVTDAVRWIHENAVRVGATPDKIILMGDSAGANLAYAATHKLCEPGAQSSDGRSLCPAFVALLVPAVIPNGQAITRSRERFADGYLLTLEDMEFFSQLYCNQPGHRQCSQPYVSISLLPDLNRMPRAYVAVAGFDPLRDEGLLLARSLEDAGVSVSVAIHDNLTHNFVNLAPIHSASRKALFNAADAIVNAMDEASAVLQPPENDSRFWLEDDKAAVTTAAATNPITAPSDSSRNTR